jgi:hypothetical protein
MLPNAINIISGSLLSEQQDSDTQHNSNHRYPASSL